MNKKVSKLNLCFLIVGILLIPWFVHADTLPPGMVKSKTLDGSGNPIGSTSGALNVNVTGGGGPSTVTANQGTAGSFPWLITGSTGRTWSLLNTTDSVNAVQSGTWNLGRTWTLNSGTDSVTIAGSITATNSANGNPGAAIPAQATLIAGKDGSGNLQPLLAPGGVLSVSASITNPSVGTPGSPVPASATYIATKDSSGNLSPLKITPAGVLSVDGSSVTQPVSGSVSVSNFPATQAVSQSGTWTVMQGTPPWSQNLTQLNGASPSATNYLPSRITNGTVYVDPTQIRALTSADIITADQGGAPWSVSQSGTWNLNNITGTISLPTGASTSALQSTANTSLASILANQTNGTQNVNATQAGVWNVTNISGTVSLPTGAATSANQASQLTQETTTATNTTSMLANQTNGTQKTQVTSIPSDLMPATQNLSAADVVTVSNAFANGQLFYTGTPTAGSAASFALPSVDAVEVQVTGTWTGTVQTEVSMDGGTTWFTRGVKQTGSSYIGSSYTANFEGGMNFGGMTNVRVRAVAAWSGTATVKVTGSVNPASLLISNPLTLRDSTTQSITSAIKAASTAALATDNSLVVALSPNSALPAGANAIGSVSVSNFPATQPVSGTVTANQGGAPWSVAQSGTWNITNVSGTVSLPTGASTAANQTNGSAKSQIVDGSANVIGPAVTVSGTNYMPVVQASSGAAGSAAPARITQVGGSDGTNLRTMLTDASGTVQASLGNTNKTVAAVSGSLSSTTITANQTVATRTVTVGKTFYISEFDCSVVLNSAAATQEQFGTCGLMINGVTVWSQYYKGPGTGTIWAPIVLPEPLYATAGQIVSIVATPAATTNFLWTGNIMGYEK